MTDVDIGKLLDVSGLPMCLDDDSMPVVYEPTVLVEIESNPQDRSKDLEEDYKLARQGLNYQQQMLMAMGKIALENAKNSESPRHVDSFVNLMNSMTVVNKEVLRVHKEMTAITNEGISTKKGNGEQPTMNIENATVFVGTPAELMAREGTQLEANSRNIEGDHNVIDA